MSHPTCSCDSATATCPRYGWMKGAKYAVCRSEPSQRRDLVLSVLSKSPQMESPKMRWAYGVTTCKQRKTNLLPRTIASLKNGGFPEPHLFVDGEDDPASWEIKFGLPVTIRNPAVRTAGNWALSAIELYLRQPDAELYAIFQDDLVCVRNLRAYLERAVRPTRGYMNLYTFPQNEDLAAGRNGFYESNQRGRGAVALVFSREALLTLFQSQHFVERPQDQDRGHRSIDGGIVASMEKAGWKEFVHYPSLVQHTGLESSMGNRKHPLSRTFPGEAFDALGFLQK